MKTTLSLAGLAVFTLAFSAADPPADGPAKVDTPSVPNLIRLNDRIYQGAKAPTPAARLKLLISLVTIDPHGPTEGVGEVWAPVTGGAQGVPLSLR